MHGHASLQEAASVTRPFLVPFHLPHWAAATSERRRARIERARRGARQLVAQQQWQHDRSGAAAQAKLGAARFHASDGAVAAIGYAPGVAHLGPHQRLELTEIN